MKYNTINKFKSEILPDWEYIPIDADKIILGTFPTKYDNRSFEFFYPNNRNKFWEILSEITGINLSKISNNEIEKNNAVSERKNILNKLKLGISDMGKIILRQNNSSLDNDIFPIEFNDVFTILEEYPNIKTIIFTSGSSGNSAYSWFKAYCNINNISINKNEDNEYPKEYFILLNDIKIKIFIVKSTSPRATRKDEHDILISMYKKVLGK